jgi:hypothetical protein
MKISVQSYDADNIRSVQSPSHPITMHLGGHAEDVADNAFDPKRALANLNQTTTELGKDFILVVINVPIYPLLVPCSRHTLAFRLKALMVTLVPSSRFLQARCLRLYSLLIAQGA